MVNPDIALSLRDQGYTLQEIGDRFQVSRERIRQIIGNTYCRSLPIREHVRELAKLVWEEESLTIQEVSQRFHVTIPVVKRILGTRWAYWRKRGKRRCTCCRRYLPLDRLYPHSCICKRCNTKRCLAFYHERTHRRFGATEGIPERDELLFYEDAE